MGLLGTDSLFLRLLRTSRARLVEDIRQGFVKVVTAEINLEINLESVIWKMVVENVRWGSLLESPEAVLNRKRGREVRSWLKGSSL